MKNPKMVVALIQRQLRNMKCSDDDDLREHLGKAPDLYTRLNDMRATITQAEFLDIILTSIPPSYKLVMNALKTSLEEVGKSLEADNIIRILKSQYDRQKTLSILKEEHVFMGTLTKKQHISTNCKKSGHSIEMCWGKGGGKEGQGLKQKKRKQQKKRKKGKSKANTAEKLSDEEGDESSVTFINFDCAALIKDRSDVIFILDTGASFHMTPHQS